MTTKGKESQHIPQKETARYWLKPRKRNQERIKLLYCNATMTLPWLLALLLQE